MPFIFKIPSQVVPVKIVFSGTGSIQPFNVPANVTTINIKMWGAGGGAGATDASSRGGGGGFVSGTLVVTPSTILDVYVGIGGLIASANGGWPGGGGTGAGGEAGAGGGFSAIFPNGDFITPYILAGAGAGGSTDDSYPGGGLQNWYSLDPGKFNEEGQPGSQTSGGAGGNVTGDQDQPGQPGGFLFGGNGASVGWWDGGGGGSGYYGGGGGSGGTFPGFGGRGGGGSSYIGHSNLNGTGITISNPNVYNSNLMYLAANEVDVDWPTNAGRGAQQSGNGLNGAVVISYIG